MWMIPLSTDLGLLERSDLNFEGALNDVLSTVRHVDDVVARLLRLVDTRVGVRVQAADLDRFLDALWPEDLDDKVALSRALCVHLEVGIVAHSHALRLYATTRRVAFASVHGCKYSDTCTFTSTVATE